MQVVVTGKNVDVPSQVKDQTVAKLSKVARLIDPVAEMEVVFFEDRNPRISDRIHCEVIVHSKRNRLVAEAKADRFLTAVDLVRDKLEQQARRHKEKVIDRSHGKLHDGGRSKPRREDDLPAS